MDISTPAPLSLPVLVFNLLLGLSLSVLMAFYYTRWGSSLSNRAKFAPNLPFLTLVTLLIITIVKSSLALSLGLVGALSIVRFRTAIKDPEELMFLFFAIALGLGMGADQRVPTVVAFCVIMLYLVISKLVLGKSKRSLKDRLYLNVDIPGAAEGAFEGVSAIVANRFGEADLRRMDQGDDALQIVYYISAKHSEGVAEAFSEIRKAYPGARLSIVEQNNILGA